MKKSLYEAIYDESLDEALDFPTKMKAAAASAVTAGALAAGGTGVKQTYDYFSQDQESSLEEPEYRDLEGKVSAFTPGSVHVGKDYSGLDLSNLDLRDVDLSYTHLDGVNFYNSRFTNVNFEGATLGGANFDQSTFIETNVLDAGSLMRARFYDCTYQSIIGDGKVITSYNEIIDSLLSRGALAHRGYAKRK